MQHEHPQTISNENYQILQSVIFGTEVATLLPEHAAMFAAENDACFVHFIDTLPDQLREEVTRAENGDKDAILALSDAYHEYRDRFESDLAQNNPEAYNDFIEAVTIGNIEKASALVDDFHQTRNLANLPVIDDELDAQFI